LSTGSVTWKRLSNVLSDRSSRRCHGAHSAQRSQSW
jgi:hypothetical protein